MTAAIPDFLSRRAELGPAAPAFHDLDSDEKVDFGELDARAARAVTVLESLGTTAGDRVAVLCRNRIAFFEILFACARIGAVLVPLNWRMPATELAPLMRDAQPRVLAFGAEDEDSACALSGAANALLPLDGEGADAYRARRDAAVPATGRRMWPSDETWYLIYTSGTTGKPKAVIYTYGMAVANYVSIRQGMQIGPNDVTLNFLPLFHTAGINLLALPTLIEGGLSLMIPGFDAERIVELLERGALNTFFGVPACYQEISLHPRFDSLDLSALRCGCGGAPLPDDLIGRFLERGARVCNGMGMSETGPTVFLMDPSTVAEKIGSVGKPQLLAAVRIVDREGKDVAPGEQGELLFAGPGVTPGYWGHEEATRDAFTADGWLRSGDIGRVDEDGYYYIAGRIKDMFISGGENVYPAEVENLLAGHPDVLEAAVVAMADRRWGEVGCAFLLPRPGHSLPADDALTKWCRQRLAPYKVPKRFVAVDDFPRTAAGKIQKHRLEPPQ